MKNLLMLGTAKGSKEMLLEAKNRGYHTIVTDYLEPNESRGKLISDEYWMISTSDFDTLENLCKEKDINGICNGISTFNISATMELTKRLNMPCYCTPESWHYTIDKRDFKDACIKNNVPVPKDYYLSDGFTEEELNNIQYPVVVKAIDQSANRGMSYCFSSDEIAEAIKNARSVSNSDTVVVERMLRGHEYTAWYALADGKASLINFAKMYHKEGYPSNCYSVTTTYTDNLDLYLEEVDQNIQAVFADIGCKEGIAWIEMMLDEDGHFYVIEMGYRMSGDMMALVHKNVCNFNSYAWLLDIAVGVKHTEKDLPMPEVKLPERVGCSYILWSKDAGIITKWDGFDALNGKYNINIETTLGVGSKVNKHQYLAVITFDTSSYQEMCEAIEFINSNVEIWNEKENIIIYYDNLESLKIDESHASC
jgi:carbamoylphosphate synthase large subunit